MRALALKSLLLCVLLISIPRTVFGFGYYDSARNGSRTPGLTAISAAAGGTVSQKAYSAAALFLNPAELALLDGTTVSLNGGWLTWSESVREAEDLDWIWRGNNILGTATGAMSVEAGPLVVAAGAAKVADFDYRGIHTMETPVFGWEEFAASGAQWEFLAGAAANVSNSISAGVSGGVRRIEAEFDRILTHPFNPSLDSSYHWSVSDREFCWHAGLMVSSDIADAGISYVSETEHYPRIFAVGASVVSPHLRLLRTGFELEFAGPSDKVDITGKLFLQYPLRSNLSLYASAHFLEEQETTMGSHGFGAGCGYLHGNRFGADIGFLFKTRRRGGHTVPATEAIRVNDSSVSVVGGLFYRL